MRRTVALLLLLSACLAAVVLTCRAQTAQQASGPAAPPRLPSPSGMSQATLDDMLIRFPLPPGQEVYADIDGKRMHRDVVGATRGIRRTRPSRTGLHSQLAMTMALQRGTSSEKCPLGIQPA